MGPLIIVSGPSGCGKTTLIRRLLEEGVWPLQLSVSVTTRKPRINEEPGVAYHFRTVPEFLKERDKGQFLEWAEVHGNYYGTLEQEVKPYRELFRQGVVLDIDVQGAEQVRKRCPDAMSIFVRTSKFETLEERLRKRHTDPEESIQKRLANARAELARAEEYDHQVINDDLEVALASMRAILGPLFK
ncbi:MAG: guanylate kinase [Gemmataceae bacterium]|nr:guanylate kinase [Gemmataceae bacterium]